LSLLRTGSQYSAQCPIARNEQFVVAAIAAAVYLSGYVQAVRLGGSAAWLRVSRVVTGAACYLAQLVGAALFIAGHEAGLYVAAVALVILLAFMVSGAWLLIVGVSERQSGHHDTRSPRSES
jgi:hypothetical protein